jgi:hypothetical protein
LIVETNGKIITLFVLKINWVLETNVESKPKQEILNFDFGQITLHLCT